MNQYTKEVVIAQSEPKLFNMFSNLKGIFAILFILINTLIGYPFLLTAAFLKLLIPFHFSRKLWTKVLIVIATIWIENNNFLFRKLLGIKINSSGEENFSRKEWYLVLSNHQTWSDIIILQMFFNKKIPLLKFFIKKELIWVPLLGIAWWALDFPFMKRYSSEFLKKNPSLKGKDIEATKKACEKFRYTPVSIMNFVEGTRFTKARHERQQSTYKNLLKPKAGGVAFVFSSMGNIIHCILDVTIKYPSRDFSFWHFLCGRIKEVHIHVEKITVTPELIGDYENDSQYQESFKKWINELWLKKDKQFDSI